MSISSFFLLASDAAMKWAAQEFPLGQMLCLRGAFGVAAIALYVALRGRFADLRVVNIRGQALRAALMVGATYVFFYGLRAMPLVEVTTLTFIAPIVVAALSPFVLKESVGWRRWSAIAVGFLGVVVMLRPSPEGIYWIALVPVAASTIGALRDLTTRHLTLTETSLAVLFYTTVAETAVGLATLPFGWRPIDLEGLAVLAAGGLLFVIASFMTIEAYRFARAATVSPFRYVSLIWAVLFGYVLWDERPDGWTLSGAAIIIGSGLYILHHERRRRRA